LLAQSSPLNESRLKLLVGHCLLAAASKKPYNLNYIVVKQKYKDGKQCSNPRWGERVLPPKYYISVFEKNPVSLPDSLLVAGTELFFKTLDFQIQYTSTENTSNHWMNHFNLFSREPHEPT